MRNFIQELYFLFLGTFFERIIQNKEEITSLLTSHSLMSGPVVILSFQCNEEYFLLSDATIFSEKHMTSLYGVLQFKF